MHLDTATNSVCFDDVLLVPKKSSVVSRSSVDVKTKLGNPNNPAAHINLDIPFLMAPMDFISTNEMIYKIIKTTFDKDYLHHLDPAINLCFGDFSNH